ncbi:MAG: D-aminoacyl-tRNA deacylase [Defluviitaleaceae bacterium]|nr:D-aminoacyl-tRNA deacylase [Defluviitaleaceae bacterium]
MKALIQRVARASVSVGDEVIGEIGFGYAVLLGFGKNDSFGEADKMIEKIKNLRIFPDAQGKTNLSIDDVSGELLLVSQFTLYADCKKGNRPSFAEACEPKRAEALYDYFCEKSAGCFKKVACGSFGAAMEVSLVNEGPFTILLEI